MLSVLTHQILYCLDKDMIIAAQTPMSETQQICIHWMKNHFEICGDKSPNRDETHLIIMTKLEVYQTYEKQMADRNQKTVSSKLFNTLWRDLFPTCVARPWVDIPGKCSTCAYIDQMRRSSRSEVVQENLKKAFSLHRGGMFMLERAS